MWQTIILVITSLPGIIKSLIELWNLISKVGDKEIKKAKRDEFRYLARLAFIQPKYAKARISRLRNQLKRT